MLASVFNVNKRRTQNAQSRKKKSAIPGIRRVQSPPSPASFVSPEIVEINEQGPFGGSFPEHRAPSSSLERSVASVASPQLQLEFDTDEPLFPSILSQGGNRTPPKRNVSLPNGGRSAEGSTSRARAFGSEDNTIWEGTLQPNRLQVDTSVQASSSSEDASENNGLHSTRKPTPSPIKIPNNSTSAKIKVQSSAENSADGNSSIPPPLPTKNSRPPSPASALTDDISSAVSGTSMARALVATSFTLSSESRSSRYKSGMTRQDSATLPRGEHPLINSPYMRERRASEPGSERSSIVPPVPRLPSRADLGLSIDSSTGSTSQRNSVALVLESGESDQLVPPPQLKRPKSTGRLRREQGISMPPISPISEASSPAPSVPETPGHVGQSVSNQSNGSNRSLANSLAQQRAPNLSEGNASSSSLGTDASSHHARAATEPGASFGTSADRRPSNAQKPKGTLAPAMPGTMRSSGAFAITNGRLAVTRTMSESGVSRGGPAGPARPAVLLPIGERPSSVLVPPSPQPSVASNLGAPTPTSTRLGPTNASSGETPVDSPDLLDNFPLQIARERSAGPPPPLPLGRRSEDNSAIPTPLQSSSGESTSGASMNRQTFPETPNAFSPLWSGTFASPPANARSSLDQSAAIGRNGSVVRPGNMIDMTRMASRGPGGRMSNTIFGKPSAARSSRVPPTPPLTGESASGSQPDSPVVAEQAVSQAIKRLTAIEEQVASRSVSQYSTIPEPPTSGAQYGGGAFAMQQQQQQQQTRDVARPRGGRERSESVSAQSVAPSVAPSQAQTQASSNMSAAAQAKAAEAAAHRRMRSVTNPDDPPLASPPPSYPVTFDPPPPPTPLLHTRAATTDSEQSHRSSMVSGSTHLQASSQSSVPQKRSLSPFPSPPPSSVPLPPSPGLGRSRQDAHASSISVEQPPPPYMELARGGTPPVPPTSTPPPPPTLAPAPNSRPGTGDSPAPHAPPSTPLRTTSTPDSTPTKRPPRVRPRLPQGPRAPSHGSAAARMRAGSVSSLNSGVAGGSSSTSRMASIAAQSAPRFQPSRVHFRGLTMEAAQWTLTSQQLQHIVSTAIRQSADASAIRILPHETLEHELPEEIARLEARSAELKTNYKLGVRRRNAALATIARFAEDPEHVEHGAVVRAAEELNDLNESLDQVAEELYTVTDQLGQLARLRDLHQRSALAMALRKLNSSFLKQVGEVQRLRELVETLEAERDEAWQEAQEVAQEFDDFTERIMPDVAGPAAKEERTPSRRSSRVLLARKTSQRASKAGLRSSMYRRSQRSSTSSSHRYSGAASPGAWVPPGGAEDIPPVPPIPTRRDLVRFPSGDLPTRSSMDSPSSELRAMVQAQKELCEMLGISLEELKVHQPSRRQSMSAIPGPRSPASGAPTRRNSDIVTPNHQRSFKV